jgi:hypothetical protein
VSDEFYYFRGSEPLHLAVFDLGKIAIDAIQTFRDGYLVNAIGKDPCGTNAPRSDGSTVVANACLKRTSKSIFGIWPVIRAIQGLLPPICSPVIVMVVIGSSEPLRIPEARDAPKKSEDRRQEFNATALITIKNDHDLIDKQGRRVFRLRPSIPRPTIAAIRMAMEPWRCS